MLEEELQKTLEEEPLPQEQWQSLEQDYEVIVEAYEILVPEIDQLIQEIEGRQDLMELIETEEYIVMEFQEEDRILREDLLLVHLMDHVLMRQGDQTLQDHKEIPLDLHVHQDRKEPHDHQDHLRDLMLGHQDQAADQVRVLQGRAQDHLLLEEEVSQDQVDLEVVDQEVVEEEDNILKNKKTTFL